MNIIDDEFCVKLFNLIYIGDLDSLKENLKLIDDINSIYFQQMTLLFKAVATDKLEIVKYLVSMGSDVNSLNCEELITPFQAACIIGNMDMIRFLYLHGARDSQTQMHEYNALNCAIEGGQLNVVKFLINDLKYNVNERNTEYERSLVHLAIQFDKFDIFQYLISSGADIDLPDINSISPLIYCATYSLIDYAKCLIFNGADVNLSTNNNASPLYYAIKGNHLEMVKLLLKSGALFSENYQEISMAIKYHYNDIAIYLINFTSIVYIPGQFSALEDSLYYNNIEILKYLLKIGVSLNQMKSGSCFIFACLNSSEEIVRYLMSQGCDVNQTENFNNLPPMREWRYKNDDAFRYISENSSDNDYDDDFNNFMENTFVKPFYPVLYFVALTNRLSIAKLLIDNGADPNQNTALLTPLFPAIYFNNFEMVKLLIDEGAKINMNLHTTIYAFVYTSPEILDYVLQNQISNEILSNEKNIDHFPILFPVIYNCYNKLLRSLIKQNIRVDYFVQPNSLVNYEIEIQDAKTNTQRPINQIIDMFEILCKAGIGLYDCPDHPLLFGYVNAPEFFKYLIKKGVNIGSLYKGKNIIHQIASKGNIDLLKYVLDFKIPFYKTDNKGRTPYDIAFQKGNYEIASFLDYLYSQNK